MRRIIQSKVTTIHIFSAEFIWADEDVTAETITVEMEPQQTTSPPKQLGAGKSKKAGTTRKATPRRRSRRTSTK